MNLVGAEKDAGNTRARSVRRNGIAGGIAQNVGGERGVSGNLAHFIVTIHQIKLS